MQVTSDPFLAQARDAAQFLKLLANEQRLLILCHLMAQGEMSVGALGEQLDLSASALSQHLAKLRDLGLVAYRREAQTLYYRLVDERAERTVDLMADLFCPDIKKEFQ